MMDRRKSMTLIYLSIAVVFFLLLPQAMRILQGNPTLTGKEPYFHARMVEQVMQNRIFEQDSLVYGGRTLFYTPYHLIAAGFSFLIGIELVLRILPMICGIISMVLFYKILKKYSYDKFTRIVAVLVLASSPAFIYVFTTTQDSLAIALTIFGTYFFVNGKKKMHLVSFLFFLAASLFSLFNTLVIIIPLLMYSFIKGRRQKFSMATSIVLLGAYMINPSPVFYNLITGSPQMLKGFISDLGGPIGIGVFYLMLVIIGLVYSWQENKKYYPLYMILVLYALSFYFARGYVLGYMNFFMAIFAAQGVKIIKDLNWQMKMIKNLTFIVIACGLLFSMISFSGRLA
ncbi:MAG: glycosyltransferase family 39 protein, partial [Nanoarchaeota archaeon]|nr:glycosyltransferase family 39 protein [Nanoarchaeota archaeon]